MNHVSTLYLSAAQNFHSSTGIRDMNATDGDIKAPEKTAKPRTARGERTLRVILDAAAIEFGERGFHESSIVSITQRAGVALGSFYTYFPSKDAVFRALVADMSSQVRQHVAPAITAASDALNAESQALAAFLGFVRTHKEVYRIIDEAEFVDPDSFRAHYTSTAARIQDRLLAGARAGTLRADLGNADISEIHAWAIMGMNVFLGLRYGVWDDDGSPGAIADSIGQTLANGIAKR
jgi:AcrR family transcriptional regulator